MAAARFCRIHDSGGGDGVVVTRGARPRLVGCELWGNTDGGIYVHEGGDPILTNNVIRDHAGTLGMGVLVASDAVGLCTVGSDNVFLRNLGGNVVRDDPPSDEPENLSSLDNVDLELDLSRLAAFVADVSKAGIGAREALAYLVGLA